MQKSFFIGCTILFFLVTGCASKQLSQKQIANPEETAAAEIDVAFKIKFLNWMVSLRKPVQEMTLEEIKKQNEMNIPSPVARFLFGKYHKMKKVENRTILTRHGEIPIRLYYPSTQSDLPLIMFFHGGGWVIASIETHDRICRRIARDTGAVVISVGYHYAPWKKYPVALEDCYDATLWAIKNSKDIGVDASRLMVMGDSAGGNLAASICLMARNISGPDISGQILLYPLTDGTLSTPSIDLLANAPMLTKDMLVCFTNYYARTDQDKHEPYFSPLFAADLSNLPPALVITAQYDPLHDDGQAYAVRLKEAGNAVQVTDYPGMVHGFIGFPGYCRLAENAYMEISDYIKSLVSN